MAEWLPEHVKHMLELPGFVEAQRFKPEQSDNGDLTYTVHYLMRDQEALDTYLLEHADPMRRAGRELFGNDLHASRAVRKIDGAEMATCPNCGVSFDGQYCWNCGQKNRARVITLGELLRDGFGELFDFDSRLWRTIWPLMSRPGFLTSEYLSGRRMRYMPPFRTYLVLSFLFFLVMQVTGGSSVDFEDEGPSTEADVERRIARELASVAQEIEEFSPEKARELLASAEQRADLAQALEDAAREEKELKKAQERGEVASDAVVADTPEDEPETDSPVGDSTNSEIDSEVEPSSVSDPEGIDEMPGLQISSDPYGNTDCVINLDFGIPMLQRLMPPERQTEVCQDLIETKGRRLFERMEQSAPAVALLLLPVMALVLKLLYPLTGKYYVEHLLTLMHYHAFAFTGWLVITLYEYIADALGFHEALMVIPAVIGGIYIWTYLYRALRQVYSQGHLWTIPKFVVINAAYLASIVLMHLMTLIYIEITY